MKLIYHIYIGMAPKKVGINWLAAPGSASSTATTIVASSPTEEERPEERRKVRGKSFKYIVLKIYQSEEEAQLCFTDIIMESYHLKWTTVKNNSSGRHVRNIKCSVKGCDWVARLVVFNSEIYYEGKDEIHEHEQVVEGNNLAVKAKLSAEQKLWIKDLFDHNYKTKGEILHRMIRMVDDPSMVAPTAIPDPQQLQNYLRRLQINEHDPNLMAAGSSLTPVQLKDWAESHGIDSVDRNSPDGMDKPFCLAYEMILNAGTYAWFTLVITTHRLLQFIESCPIIHGDDTHGVTYMNFPVIMGGYRYVGCFHIFLAVLLVLSYFTIRVFIS